MGGSQRYVRCELGSTAAVDGTRPCTEQHEALSTYHLAPLLSASAAVLPSRCLGAAVRLEHPRCTAAAASRHLEPPTHHTVQCNTGQCFHGSLPQLTEFSNTSRVKTMTDRLLSAASARGFSANLRLFAAVHVSSVRVSAAAVF